MSISLVTGGAGFIGSHVVDELLAAGHQVVVLDDLSGGRREYLRASAVFVEGSVADEETVRRVFAEYRFDYVFHLAAYAAEGLSHFIRRFNYTNNLIGSVNLINAAVNAGSVRCFVFSSSIAVYGWNQVPMTEDLAPLPADPYGIAKFAVERDLAAAREVFGLPFIIFRPHNVYGERQNIADPYRNVVGIFMNEALRGEPFTVFGDGLQTRAFTCIGDVAPVIARSCERLEAYDQVFNVGSEVPRRVLDLASIVADAMGVPLRIRHLEPRPEVTHAFASHDKARRVFSDLIRGVPLEEGINAMARWCRTAGPQERTPFQHVEVVKHLPPIWRELIASAAIPGDGRRSDRNTSRRPPDRS